jgi:hypothetical protein
MEVEMGGDVRRPPARNRELWDPNKDEGGTGLAKKLEEVRI